MGDERIVNDRLLSQCRRLPYTEYTRRWKRSKVDVVVDMEDDQIKSPLVEGEKTVPLMTSTRIGENVLIPNSDSIGGMVMQIVAEVAKHYLDQQGVDDIKSPKGYTNYIQSQKDIE